MLLSNPSIRFVRYVLVAFSRPRGERRYWEGEGCTIIDVVGQERWDFRVGLRCFFSLLPIVAMMETQSEGNTDEAHEGGWGGELAMEVEDVGEIERRDGME